MFVGPVLVIFIIEYIDDPVVNYTTITWILSTLFISKYLSSILTQIVYFKCQVVGQRIKAVLDTAIYFKVLKFSLLRTSKYSAGDLINMLLVDTNKIYYLFEFFRGVIMFPILMSLALFFMYT